MTPEKAKEIYDAVKLDIDRVNQQLNQQQLMGGVRPEHILQVLDMKTNMAISIGMSILESYFKNVESSEATDKSEGGILLK